MPLQTNANSIIAEQLAIQRTTRPVKPTNRLWTNTPTTVRYVITPLSRRSWSFFLSQLTAQLFDLTLYFTWRICSRSLRAEKFGRGK